jgi:hypothetical protein
MKKLAVLALMAFGFLAMAQTTRVNAPLPTCNPCPFVR